MASEKNHYNRAPIVQLSVIAPSLDPTPEYMDEDYGGADSTFVDIPGGDEISTNSTLTVPMEVKFQDQDSIMSSRRTSIDEGEVSGKKPKIPDGGWGWMIVFSSLILSMIQDGISFSFGILYVEFFNEFRASSSTTSWIGSLFVSVPLLTGPIMSALVDKYGCRAMTVVGGLVSASGFILSSFARSIGVMYLTFGVLAGLGLGLTYITAVVSIAFWFDKKRNLAVGLGACGTGIGTFVYAPFTTLLLYEFGWRWTVVLLAGTLLNICICGALMRDPDWIIEQNRQNSKLSKSSKGSKSSKSSTLSIVSSPSEKVNLEEIRGMLKSGKDAEYILQHLALSVQMEKRSDEEAGENKNKEHHNSVLNLPTYIRQDEKVPVEVLEQLSANKRLYKIILQNYPSLLLCRSTSDKGLNKMSEEVPMRIPVTFSLKLKKTDKPKTITHQFSLPEQPAVTEPLLGNNNYKANGGHQKQPKIVKNAGHHPPQVVRTNSAPWLVKQFSTTNPHQNYFKNMRFPRHSLIHHRGAVLNKNKYRLRASSCPNIYRVSMTTLAKEEDERWYTTITTTFKEMFDFSLFLEFHFFLMALSTVILFSWFMTPFFYLADLMKMMDYTQTEASLVMSVIGITNTIGMVGFGWAGDKDWCNVSKCYAVCLILCGVFLSSMMFFVRTYIVLVIFAALFGLMLSSSFAFTPTILMELIPLDRFTTAYGLVLLCQGIGHLAGPPLAGALYDLTDVWDYSFHLSGIWIIVSGILIFVIPFTRNRKIIGSGPVEKELANEC